MVLEFFFNQSTKRVASGEALPCENYQKQGLSSTDTFNIFWVSSQYFVSESKFNTSRILLSEIEQQYIFDSRIQKI